MTTIAGSAIAPDATIDQRWNAVLAHLPAIGKDSRNEQQGFRYRGIDAVQDKLNPLLGFFGVHIIPVRQTYERSERTTARGTIMHVCYVTVDWEIRGLGGDVIGAQTVGEGTDSGDKSTSKAQTMAFKYLLWPALTIAENEDPDGATQEDTVRPTPAGDPIPTGYEEVNGERIPTFETAPGGTERTGPEGQSARGLTDGQIRAVFAMVKGAYGRECDVGLILSQIVGREVRHPREVWMSEFDQVKAQCALLQQRNMGVDQHA